LLRGVVVAHAVDEGHKDISSLEWAALNGVEPPGGGQPLLDGFGLDPEAEHEAQAIALYASRGLRL
jgi:hypothetical protein